MKKHLFVLAGILIMGCLAAQAQDKDAQLRRIRQLYAQAKQMAADNGKGAEAPLDMHICIQDGEQASEDFALTEQTDLYFYFNKEKTEPDTDFLEQANCYLIIMKWESYGHTNYREMLFDLQNISPVTHQPALIFSYMRGETDAAFVVETRYYYDADGNLLDQKHMVGGQEATAEAHTWSTADGDKEEAARYLTVFNKLLNHDYSSPSEPESNHSTVSKEERMKYIRDAYAQAKQKTEQEKSVQLKRNVQVTIHDLRAEDFPPLTTELNYYFDGTAGRNPSTGLYSNLRHCYFLSEHSTCMYFDNYSEYLFTPLADSKSQTLPSLIFSYCLSYEEGAKREWRYYFDEFGNCIEQKSNAEETDAGSADRMAAQTYLEAFNKLLEQ